MLLAAIAWPMFATTPASAARVVVGQHLDPRIVGLPEPAETSMYVRDLAAMPAAPRAVAPVPSGRMYMSSEGVGDPRGTQAYVLAGNWHDDDYWYSLLEIDALRGTIVDALDVTTYDDVTRRRVWSLALDAAHGRLFAVVVDSLGTSIWRMSRAPLAVAAKLPFACAASDNPVVLAATVTTAGGSGLLTGCRNRLATVDAGTGAELAATEVTAPGGGNATMIAMAYDDVAGVLYIGLVSTSGYAILAYDAATLDLARIYPNLAGIDSMFVDGAGNVMFTDQARSVEDNQGLYRLDPRTGAVMFFDTLPSLTRMGSEGRSNRAVGTRLPVCHAAAPCEDAVLVEYDVVARRTSTSVLDDRASNDPTRENLEVAIDFIAPTARAVEAIEYVRADKDHYFVTADPNEIAALDGGAFAGWARTGQSFPVFAAAADSGDPTSPVCRFYGRPEAGLDTHFYSALPQECAAMKPMFGDAWIEETLDAFDVYPVNGDGSCPNGTAQVFRLFNNRSDANHRYTTSRDVRAAMIAKGWASEGLGADGVGFCVPRS